MNEKAKLDAPTWFSMMTGSLVSLSEFHGNEEFYGRIYGSGREKNNVTTANCK